MANNVVDKLVAKLDEQTRVAIEARPETFRSRKLLLVGSEESRYLKGVAAKAKKLGLLCEPYEERLDNDFRSFCAFDRETSEPWYEGAYYDLDCLWNPNDPSCTAEACLWVLEELKATEGVHVCMIGRGHAVKGLAERLLLRDATVTICHSKTNADGLRMLTRVADITVNTARTLHPYYHFAPCAGSVLLDVSGSLSTWECSNTITYVGPRDIGRLNISILLNRFVNR